MENFTFTLDKVHHFRARIDATHPRSFGDVVNWFQRQGTSRSRAIVAARKTYPNLYNAEHQLFNQRQGPAPSHLTRRDESQVSVLDMRRKSGVPLVQFQGL